MPFRFDRHPDHLAVNHAVIGAQRQGLVAPARLYEYFVYYRWRLLPGRDLRRYIHPHHLLAVDTEVVSRQKRQALDCYASQTTLFSPWQTRPILTPAARVREVCVPFRLASTGRSALSCSRVGLTSRQR
jgi:LmbE family N-acetylglucosaminyl deacetylase